MRGVGILIRPTCLILLVAISTYWVFYGTTQAANMVASFVLAFTLFSVRKRFRVCYGLIELGFGIFVLFNSWSQGRGSFSSDFSNDFDVFRVQIILLQAFGAIFVMIRGLDNIDQGSQATKARHPYVARIHAVFRRMIAIL